MTVLFGYVSQNHDAAFLCGDDLAFGTKAVVNKVFVWGTGMAGAIAGPEFLLDAVGLCVNSTMGLTVVNRDGSSATVVDSARKLAELLPTVLPRMAKRQDESYRASVARGAASAQDYELWSDQEGVVVVLNYVNKTLDIVKNHTCVGNLVEGIPARITTERLVREQVYRFAGAHVVSPVTEAIVGDPRTHATAWLEVARASAHRPETIGTLGASITRRGNDVVFQSAHNTLAELLEAHGY